MATTIPKTIHIVWVGDESARPDSDIQTWRDLNPRFTLKVWGNDALRTTRWTNAHHIEAMARREWSGVADMMRWEILVREGGFTVDADSTCIRPLEDWLFDCDMFACWENEIARPGLIAAGFVAAAPGNALLSQIVSDIRGAPTVTDKLAWETVGPMRLTQSYHRYRFSNLTIYPSHYFLPDHFTGVRYTGTGPIFARHKWSSTARLLGA